MVWLLTPGQTYLYSCLKYAWRMTSFLRHGSDVTNHPSIDLYGYGEIAVESLAGLLEDRQLGGHRRQQTGH